jgi:hypothetical protein
MRDQTSPDSPPPVALLQMLFGAQTAQLAYVMAKLNLADLLRDGPQSSAELAAATHTDADALRRVLRGLTSIGLCTEVEAGRFGLTPTGSYLRTDVPGSLHPRALFNGEILFPLWGDLLRTVQTGQGATERVFGAPLYQYFAQHPDVGALFDRTMASAAHYRLLPAVEAYDFSRFHSIIDVGGGNGALVVAILRTYPQPRGVVFDFPAVTERATEQIRTAGLTDRCTAVGGNAMEGVPAGGDCYVLSNFVVGMDDGQAGRVLRNCRAAMADSGTLLLSEWVMPAGSTIRGVAIDDYTFWDTATMDLIMLTHGGAQAGRVRTEAEFRSLLEATGFRLTAIVPTASPIKVLEAVPTS